MVEVTGLEPATSCSQSRSPTNWATPRYQPYYTTPCFSLSSLSVFVIFSFVPLFMVFALFLYIFWRRTRFFDKSEFFDSRKFPRIIEEFFLCVSNPIEKIMSCRDGQKTMQKRIQSNKARH